MATAGAPTWDLPPVRARILVKGASSAIWVSPPNGPRTSQTFPWWLEAELSAAGLPCEVRNAGVEAQKITEALCDWDVEVEQWSPDVVVLNYGQYECMPGMLPRWLERHAVGWHKHSGPIRTRYHSRVLKPLWRRLVSTQRQIDRRLDPGPYRTSPRRTAAEYRRLIQQIRITGTPLVLVMDTWPLSSRWLKWFPAMQTRIDIMRQVLVDLVAAIDKPEVRLFSISDIVNRNDHDTVLPDGVHFSADLHRQIGRELAAVILPWAAGEPHLQHPSLDPGYFVRRATAAPAAEH